MKVLTPLGAVLPALFADYPEHANHQVTSCAAAPTRDCVVFTCTCGSKLEMTQKKLRALGLSSGITA